MQHHYRVHLAGLQQRLGGSAVLFGRRLFVEDDRIADQVRRRSRLAQRLDRGVADRANVRFIGLANYRRLFETPLFWTALGNTAVFVFVGADGVWVLADGRVSRDGVAIAPGDVPAVVRWREERERLRAFMTTVPFTLDLDAPLNQFFGDNRFQPGMAYLVRRLLENTSNDSFLRASFEENVSPEKLLERYSADVMPLRTRCRASCGRLRVAQIVSLRISRMDV